MSTKFLKSKSSKVLLLIMLSMPIVFSQLIASCTYSKPLSAKEVDMGNLLTWSTSEEMLTDNFQV